ncbi:hypothetical protein [Streptomyces sp. NPDC048191]
MPRPTRTAAKPGPAADRGHAGGGDRVQLVITAYEAGLVTPPG